MRSSLFATAFAALALAAPMAFSQGAAPDRPTPGQPGSPGQPGTSPRDKSAGKALDKQDRDFIDEAAVGGLFEVRAGQLAVQKAQSPDVKAFGQRMVDDHTAVNGRLIKLAQQKGVDVPADLDKKHKDILDSLDKKSGNDFDKDYIDRMKSDHEHDVKAFQKAAREAKDPDVKQLAASTLPTLEEHLSLVKQVEEKLKKTSQLSR